ncbi:Branched-chain amino acid transport protein (AzlD) [Xylanibacter ruminicola]|uniref:Branched-chain amino acid transport protein (AzlD) n=2 Tax=Xylanibacter ruminicola TaxID=839 RepID=A0A1M6WCU6_XYLRU|nr:Branched-chain amino acid transport protein (AzlD) [Xylanibacter ruminicola]
MEQHSILIYILLAIVVTNMIRVIPMAFIKGPINNRFVRSFLYYVPYVTLAVMTFPDMVLTTPAYWPGVVALLAGIVAAWFRLGLFPVAAICSIIVYLLIII